VLMVLILLLGSACGPKPSYKTTKGKKKLKKYNEIQYKKHSSHYKKFPEQINVNIEDEDCDCPDDKH